MTTLITITLVLVVIVVATQVQVLVTLTRLTNSHGSGKHAQVTRQEPPVRPYAHHAYEQDDRTQRMYPSRAPGMFGPTDEEGIPREQPRVA